VDTCTDTATLAGRTPWDDVEWATIVQSVRKWYGWPWRHLETLEACASADVLLSLIPDRLKTDTQRQIDLLGYENYRSIILDKRDTLLIEAVLMRVVDFTQRQFYEWFDALPNVRSMLDLTEAVPNAPFGAHVYASSRYDDAHDALWVCNGINGIDWGKQTKLSGHVAAPWPWHENLERLYEEITKEERVAALAFDSLKDWYEYWENKDSVLSGIETGAHYSMSVRYQNGYVVGSPRLARIPDSINAGHRYGWLIYLVGYDAFRKLMQEEHPEIRTILRDIDQFAKTTYVRYGRKLTVHTATYLKASITL
jgi:hypothetical protein